MLPSRHRLTSPEDFTRVVRQGRRAGSPLVVVHWAPAESSLTRVGFVVSKQVGGSVVRNRVKRRLRHLMAARITGLSVAGDVVIRAQPAAAQASSSGLAQDLDRCLDRCLAQVSVR